MCTNDMGVYLRPRRLEEALSALARPHTVLAGGTDFYPARVGRAVDEDVLDFFRKEGTGYQRRMNAVLRSYMQQKRKKRA